MNKTSKLNQMSVFIRESIRRSLILISSKLKSLLDQRGFNLGLVDEIFAVFVGATLALSYSGWQSAHASIVSAILLTVMAAVMFSIAASNESRLGRRYIFYAGIAVSTFIGVWWVGDVAAHDISITVTKELRALPIGVLVWILVRECSVLFMNCFGMGRSRK